MPTRLTECATRPRVLELLCRWPDGSSERRHSSPARPGPVYRGCCWVPGISVKKLARPLPIKDATRLRTLADVVAYMTALPPHRERRQYWQRACELILAQADIMEVSRQLELALFRDATLDLVALYADA